MLRKPPFFRQVYDAAYIGTLLGYEDCALDAAFFELPVTAAFLELLQYLSPPSKPGDMESYNVGNAHLCLEVEDLEEEFERLRRLGATPRSESPVLVTFGPFTGGKVAYFRDPDGISLELVQLPPSETAPGEK